MLSTRRELGAFVSTAVPWVVALSTEHSFLEVTYLDTQKLCSRNYRSKHF